MELRNYLIIFFVVAASFTDNAESRRGGGRFRFRSYRSSSSSSSSSTRRSGSRLSSSYITYNPGLRYSRINVGLAAPYSFYHGVYFRYAGSPEYVSRRRPRGDIDVCVNYEANSNGTSMGVFTCPVLPSEPKDFTSCCGPEYAEYCCKAQLSTGAITGIVIAILVVVVCAFCGIYIYIQIKREDKLREMEARRFGDNENPIFRAHYSSGSLSSVDSQHQAVKADSPSCKSQENGCQPKNCISDLSTDTSLPPPPSYDSATVAGAYSYHSQSVDDCTSAPDPPAADTPLVHCPPEADTTASICRSGEDSKASPNASQHPPNANTDRAPLKSLSVDL